MSSKTDTTPRRCLTRLSLNCFRNYKDLHLSPQPEGLILVGPNGAGKTNILEAVSLLSPGRGLRRAPAAHFPNRDQVGTGWHVFAEISVCEDSYRLGLGQEGEQNLNTSYESNNPVKKTSLRRQARLDGRRATGQERAELAPSIWLTPAQDRLFSGGASERRRFFDRFAFAYDACHAEHALSYEKAMRQRQTLLDEGRAPPAWLDSLEHSMAKAGTAMAIRRVSLVHALQAIIDQGEDNAFPKSVLSLKGFLEEKLEGGMTSQEVSALFTQHLKDNRLRDTKAQGRTADGPHRSDVMVRHKEKNMPAALCSTGEQKALLTGLVLAQTHVLSSHLKAPPFLLLDEACAHLDSLRRHALAEHIHALGVQVWMTGTDRELFEDFEKNIEVWAVDHGHVRNLPVMGEETS